MEILNTVVLAVKCTYIKYQIFSKLLLAEYYIIDTLMYNLYLYLLNLYFLYCWASSVQMHVILWDSALCAKCLFATCNDNHESIHPSLYAPSIISTYLLCVQGHTGLQSIRLAGSLEFIHLTCISLEVGENWSNRANHPATDCVSLHVLQPWKDAAFEDYGPDLLRVLQDLFRR